MSHTITPADVERLRAETPGCAHRCHLNNAGAGLMPEPVVARMIEHLRLEARIGGYEAKDAVDDEVDETYGYVARLIGARPRNVALVENATVAFAQALSSLDFRPGDRLLTTRNDYISNQLMYLTLARRTGVEVVRAADSPAGGVDPDSVRDVVRRKRPRLVAVTHVPTNSGLVQPVEAVGGICAEADVPYLVDACQAAGQIPLDVERLRCDFLSATARKFLRGPRGAGFLFVSDRRLDAGAHPIYPDMRGARWTGADELELVPDATRFENWEFGYAGVLGLGAAARYALGVGIEAAGRRAAALAARLRARLAELNGVRVLDRGPELCAIVTAELAGRDAASLVAALRERGINTSATYREWAVIDMDEKGADSAVRISPHYYNTESETDLLVDALAELGASRA